MLKESGFMYGFSSVFNFEIFGFIVGVVVLAVIVAVLYFILDFILYFFGWKS